MQFVKGSKGQVWIETMIYTLIAFAIIGLVLAFAKPKIEEFQDKAIIEQSLDMLNEIDSRMLTSIQGGPGNKRILNLLIKKGELKIDGVNDKIIFEMESSFKYSQPNTDVQIGGTTARTEEKGRFNIVTLTKDYSNSLNITYAGVDSEKIMTQSANPYSFSMVNRGQDKFEVFEFCAIVDNVPTCTPQENYVSSCIDSTGLLPANTGDMCNYKSERITMEIDVN